MTDTQAAATADFDFTDHGSVTLLTPVSDAAQEWCISHLPADAQRLGAGYAIEPRYAGPVLDGIAEEGLSVSA